MQRTMLLMSFALVVSSNAALAATPVFQINTPEAGVQRLLAIDAYPSSAGRANPGEATPATLATPPVRSASTVSLVPGSSGEASDEWRGAVPVAVTFSRSADDGGRPRKITSSLSNPDDLLFYFLKDFQAQPRQKPERWALLLVGLCFVLYQVRRRPMRTSIGFFSGSRPIGQLSV
ncbi:hypothetical protein [Collimonas silvisoli]|uniref:hypothetical protein n=1 Tax=Collimonas silvisoli TaxID=2825884 RepID=UPI001B8BCE0E|nr:hypothetical protein [Collimonas silvisoli]